MEAGDLVICIHAIKKHFKEGEVCKVVEIVGDDFVMLEEYPVMLFPLKCFEQYWEVTDKMLNELSECLR